ncbi:hypothetical protein D3C87_268500 [compost metagenome]
MKNNYKYLKLIVVIIGCGFYGPAFSQTILRTEAQKFHGYELSQKEGILSKLKNVKDGQNSQLERKSLIGTDLNEGDAAREVTPSNYGFKATILRGRSVPFSSTNDAAGNVYITGTSSNSTSPQANFVTIKVDANGNRVWEKRQEGTVYAAEIGTKITLDAAGNPIATGIKWNGNDMDIRTVKYDAASGNVTWERVFDGGNEGLDVPTAMTIDGNGNIIIVGIAYAGTSIRYVTLKYDAAGTLLWSVIDSNEVEEAWNEPTSVAVDNAGNIAVTGFGANADYWQTYYTIKYASNGNVLWKQSYAHRDNSDPNDPDSPLQDANSIARDVTFDADGNCYVTGSVNTFMNKAGTIKYNASGQQQWLKIFRSGTDFTNAYDIIAAPNAKIYVGGKHLGEWVDDGFFLISYNQDGTENWIKETNNLIEIKEARLTLDATNLPIIVGRGLGENFSDMKFLVHKYAVDGSLAGETGFIKPFSPTESTDDFVGFGTTSSNNLMPVFATGLATEGTVFETIKLSFTTTQPVWRNIYSSDAFASQTLSTANDEDNNSYIAGIFTTVSGDSGISNYFVKKYSPTGNLEWEKVFNPSNGNEANGIDLLVNSNGELMVYLIPSDNAAYPLKVKKFTSDGTLLWDFSKNVFGSKLYAFFLDDSGNVYISGKAKENDSDIFGVFATIKISNTGSELWTDFVASTNPDDNIYTIESGKADANGNVYLVGTSGFGGMVEQNTNLAVLKYASNGTLQWFNNYDVAGHISAGSDLIFDQADGSIYVNGAVQSETEYNEKSLLVKLNPSGVLQWSSLYEEPGRHVRSYTAKQLSTGEIILVSYSVIYSVNNKIVIQKYDQNGNRIWVRETELNHFYRDFYVDASDDIFMLSQIYTSSLPYRLNYSTSAYYIGSLVKIDPAGNGTEELLVGPELSAFNPMTLLPLPDGRLMMPGTLENEMFLFQGVYFFQTEHNSLGTGEHPNPEIKSNWLGQNYPNPAIGKTEIPFYLENAGEVTIKLYDSTGKYITEVANDVFPQGYNTVEVNVSGLNQAIYFYQLVAGNFRQARKMIIK